MLLCVRGPDAAPPAPANVLASSSTEMSIEPGNAPAAVGHALRSPLVTCFEVSVSTVMPVVVLVTELWMSVENVAFTSEPAKTTSAVMWTWELLDKVPSVCR